MHGYVLRPKCDAASVHVPCTTFVSCTTSASAAHATMIMNAPYTEMCGGTFRASDSPWSYCAYNAAMSSDGRRCDGGLDCAMKLSAALIE
jgi:hypothetical protein